MKVYSPVTPPGAEPSTNGLPASSDVEVPSVTHFLLSPPPRLPPHPPPNLCFHHFFCLVFTFTVRLLPSSSFVFWLLQQNRTSQQIACLTEPSLKLQRRAFYLMCALCFFSTYALLSFWFLSHLFPFILSVFPCVEFICTLVKKSCC